MSLSNYLDDEYFQLQDFLSTLIDPLPTISSKYSLDDRAIIQTLVKQNKLYAKKVISLYQKFNSTYTNALNPHERAEKSPDEDFISKLKDKLHFYEEEIQCLKLENEAFSRQLKQHPHYGEPSQIKDFLSNPFFAVGTNPQSHPQPIGKDINPSIMAAKSMNDSFNIPSPIPRPSNLSRVSKDVSFELEHMFVNAEYNKAIELLSHFDYKIPPNIPADKFNRWLITSNKIKDSQLQEVLLKLKSLAVSCISVDGSGDWIEQERQIEELLDKQTTSVVDKIWYLLNERIAQYILKSDRFTDKRKSANRTLRSPRDEASGFQTAHFTEAGIEEELEERQGPERLRQKMRYFKGSLQDSEREIREKDAEIMLLKEKLGDAINIAMSMHNTDSGRRYGGDTSERLRVPDTQEVASERDVYRRKYEQTAREADEHKTRCVNLEIRVDSLSEEAERLKQDKALLKREIKSLKGTRSKSKGERNERGMQSYSKETLSKSAIKDLDWSDIADKEHQRTPTVSQIASPERDLRLGDLRDVKDTLLIESALQVQKNSLFTTRQVVGEFKALLSDKLRMANLESQPSTLSKADQDFDPLEPSIELQKILKNNTYIIKVINNDLRDLKRDAITIINKLWIDQAKQRNKQSVELDLALRDKMIAAEDVLMQNLSQTLQSLTSLTTALQEIEPSIGQDDYNANKMVQALDLLQVIHARLEKTIQDFPEFAEAELRSPVRNILVSSHAQMNESALEPANTTLKKRLAIDRRELTNKLKLTLQKFETSLANDVFVRLSEEIERNQALQDIIEAKNFLIHKLGLLFTEGYDKHEACIQQLCQLADSEDANRILNNVLNDFRNFYRTFNEAVIQNRSPSKSHRKLDSVDVPQVRRQTRNRSELPTEFKDSILKDSLEKSTAREKRQIDTNTKWRGHERGISELSWNTAEKDKAYEDKNRELKDINHQLRELEIANAELSQDLEGLKAAMHQVEAENRELRSNVDRAQEELKSVGRQAVYDLDARDRDIHGLKRRIEELDIENRDLREYKVNTETALKKASNQVNHLKLEYFSSINGLKEENVRLEEARHELIAEIEKKVDENMKLNQLIDNLQTLSNRQIDGMRDKEEKLAQLSHSKRESDLIVRDLEKQVEMLSGSNKRSVEKTKENVEDINSMRKELKMAVERHGVIQRDVEALKVWNKELTQEKHRLFNEKELLEGERSLLTEKLKRTSEVLEITKSELRRSHDLLDQKNQELNRKNKEIQSLSQTTPQRENYKESDHVTFMKRELAMRNEELKKVKTEHRKAVDESEKLLNEVTNLKTTNKFGQPSTRQSSIHEKDLSLRTGKPDVHASGEKSYLLEDREPTFGSTVKRAVVTPRHAEHHDRIDHERSLADSVRGISQYSGTKNKDYVNYLRNRDRDRDRESQSIRNRINPNELSGQSSQEYNNSQIKRQMQYSGHD